MTEYNYAASTGQGGIVSEELTQLVEKFQCPGCLLGHDRTCGEFKLYTPPGTRSSVCIGHVAGTMFFPGGAVYLGLPKGFNKVAECPHCHSKNPQHKPITIPDDTECDMLFMCRSAKEGMAGAKSKDHALLAKLMEIFPGEVILTDGWKAYAR